MTRHHGRVVRPPERLRHQAEALPSSVTSETLASAYKPRRVSGVHALKPSREQRAINPLQMRVKRVRVRYNIRHNVRFYRVYQVIRVRAPETSDKS